MSNHVCRHIQHACRWFSRAFQQVEAPGSISDVAHITHMFLSVEPASLCGCARYESCLYWGTSGLQRLWVCLTHMNHMIWSCHLLSVLGCSTKVYIRCLNCGLCVILLVENRTNSFIRHVHPMAACLCLTELKTHDMLWQRACHGQSKLA